MKVYFAPAKIVIFCIVFIFFFQNRSVPFFSDDLGWAGTLKGLSFSETISYFFNTQLYHWLTQNGRFTCHAVLLLLTGYGEIVYDIAISIIFGFSLIVIKSLASKNNDILLLSFSAFALLYISPDSSSNFYWAAGGCNYLLPTLLSCLFLLIIKYGIKKDFCTWQLPFLTLFSLFAGWTHEIFALPISFAIFCYICKNYFSKQKNKIPSQLWLMIVPYWLGAFLIVVSPGTLNRIAENSGAVGVPFWPALMARVVTSFKIFRYGRCFYILLGLVLYLFVSKIHSLRSFVAENYFLLLCLLVSLAIVVILGVGGRAVWGVETFSLLIILKWIDEQIKSERALRLSHRIGCIFAGIIIVHQTCLIHPFKESWDTYRLVVAQTSNPNFEGTARMVDWHSNNPLIDPFVAHPYKMMMEDIWMRSPLHCNVCRSDVYDYLASKGSKMDMHKVQSVVGEFIIPFSSEVEQAIKSCDFDMMLNPISYVQDDSFIYLTWHQLLQKLWPERYPTQISFVYPEEISLLTIKGKKYIRFEQPIRPIKREIKSVKLRRF